MTKPSLAMPPLAAVLIALWVLQLRYPPLSFPSGGLLQVVLLLALALLLPLRLTRTVGNQLPRLQPALGWGAAFVTWVLARWAFMGLPVNGAEEVSIIFATGTWLVVGYATGLTLKSSYSQLVNIIITVIAVMGLVQGATALWQYFVSYGQSYSTLLQAIGNRPPDNSELALLYHLKLRRVAGWFGDPNSLSCFSAVALCASLELLSRGSLWRLLGSLCAVACLISVYLSGSRGGALDALAVLLLFGGWMLYTRKKSDKFRNGPKIGSAIFCIALFLGIVVFGIGAAGVRKTAQVEESMPTAWSWRSSTITERLYYYEVGLKMVQRSPVVGLGPGSVDTWFGRLKSPEARETRYLHNWPLQVTAEYGMVGLALFVVFLFAILRAALRQRTLYLPGSRALLFIYILILCDALVQVTWNQREIMTTWGLLVGLLLAQPPQPAAAPQANPRRYFLLVLPALFMILVDYPYLSAKTQKQLATDFHYDGQPDRAEIHWLKASKWWPNDPEPYSARAAIALHKGEFSAAEMLAGLALKHNQESAVLNAQAAEIAAASGKMEKADALLTKALALYPTKSEYNFQKANLLLKMNQPDKALPFAEAAVKYNYTEQDAPRYRALLDQVESALTNNPVDK